MAKSKKEELTDNDKVKDDVESVTEKSADLGEFKDKLKQFKKVSKSDLKKGIELAKELIEMVKLLKVSKNKKVQKVFTSDKLNQLNDSLELYIDNVTNLLSYKKKYDNKRGVKK